MSWFNVVLQAPPKRPVVAAGPSTTILRPDGTTLSTSWDRTGGLTIHGVLSDDSDSTYVSNTTNGADDLRLTFGTSPSLGTIHSVKTRIRAKMYGGLGSYGDQYDSIIVYQDLGITANNGDLFDGSADTFGTGPITTTDGIAWTTKPSGGAWNQAAIDGLVARIINSANYSSNVRLYEVYYIVSHTP